ncbi:MAG: hypothetical protein N3F66_00230 [Spirochaetes bacterium]|nr:hypothetical protein [Spirochaetota bacterium]
MNDNNKISLCQPGNGKGCCVCCGLFNLKNISFKELSHFLSYLTTKLKRQPTNHCNGFEDFKEVQIRYTFRDNTTYVCPYMGYIGENIPGCLVHPAINQGNDSRELSLFGNEICNNYFCSAYRILDERLKKILIAYTYDWYTYSIGIIDPVSFKWIIQQIEEFMGQKIASVYSDPDKNIATVVNESLMMIADFFNHCNVTVFYYSEPEYYMHMRALSLDKNSSINHSVRDAILKKIQTRINGCYL